jgi:protein-arginine kinase activator protein McsA
MNLATLIQKAVWERRLIRSYICEQCGSKKSVHGHHDDYYKPLKVRWLCASCHGKWHRDNKAKGYPTFQYFGDEIYGKAFPETED